MSVAAISMIAARSSRAPPLGMTRPRSACGRKARRSPDLFSTHSPPGRPAAMARSWAKQEDLSAPNQLPRPTDRFVYLGGRGTKPRHKSVVRVRKHNTEGGRYEQPVFSICDFNRLLL